MQKSTDVHQLKIGILGCGTIGSRIASYVHGQHDLPMKLVGICDIDPARSSQLAKQLNAADLPKKNLNDLLSAGDVIIESIAAENTIEILEQVLRAGKDVLVMSVGKLLAGGHLFGLARKHHCRIIVPSGAVAGIDAIKAIRHAEIHNIVLTTRKPPQGLAGSPFVRQSMLKLSEIKEETVVFEGSVDEAVQAFPQNINVAATIALACQQKEKLRVRIIADPALHHNVHELEIFGEFGRMTTRTENFPCPDNPRTSYLAVLSGIESLCSLCHTEKIGT